MTTFTREFPRFVADHHPMHGWRVLDPRDASTFPARDQEDAENQAWDLSERDWASRRLERESE